MSRQCEVRAFGSRVDWTAKDYSDLDLAVRGSGTLKTGVLGRLKEAFEESDLPFRVDVLDWHATSPEFQKVIEKQYEVIQGGKHEGIASKSPIQHLEEWPVVRLGDITLKIGSGATPLGGESSYLSNRTRCALVRSQNVFDRRFDRSGLAFISDEQAERLKGVSLQAGDLLLNITGDGVTFSRCCRVPTEILPACVNQHVAIIRLNSTVADPGYVLSYLTHPSVKSYIESFNAGGSRRAITKGHIESFLVPLPPLKEQRAIAHILGTLDDKIELNRRMNETLEAMARALFKSWFVDFDPVRAKAEGRDPGLPKPLADLFPDSFEGSEIGEIPSGWVVSPVYDLATYINGAAYRAFEPNEERRGLPIIKIAELKAGVTPQTRFSDVEMPDKYRIDNGDMLFSWSGNPDTSIDIFVWNQGPAWLNQHIFRVVPNSEHERAFVLMTLRNFLPVFAEIARNKQTTGLGHVTVEDLKRLLAVRPPKSVLLGWNTFVEPLLARSFGLEGENNTLAALRDTLLPKLISGEIRIKDAARIAGVA